LITEGTLINAERKNEKKKKAKDKKKVDEAKKLKFLKLTKREEEAMRKPELYRCRNCGEVFRRSEGELIREDSEGYFYCYKCLDSMKEKKRDVIREV
jgi:predicted SprT family Zn-dependent metalloprotease